jgi:hypothetical protein
MAALRAPVRPSSLAILSLLGWSGRGTSTGRTALQLVRWRGVAPFSALYDSRPDSCSVLFQGRDSVPRAARTAGVLVDGGICGSSA